MCSSRRRHVMLNLFQHLRAQTLKQVQGDVMQATKRESLSYESYPALSSSDTAKP